MIKEPRGGFYKEIWETDDDVNYGCPIKAGTNSASFVAREIFNWQVMYVWRCYKYVKLAEIISLTKLSTLHRFCNIYPMSGIFFLHIFELLLFNFKIISSLIQIFYMWYTYRVRIHSGYISVGFVCDWPQIGS